VNGKENLINEAKSALFDAMRALGPHRNSVILVGAQAVYQHTGKINIAIAYSSPQLPLGRSAS